MIYLLAKLLKKARMSAVKGSRVHPTSKLESGTSFFQSTMDRHSFCGYDCEVSHANIGAFVSIANGVVIGGGRHPMEWVGMSPVFYEGRDSVKAKFSTHAREPSRPVTIGHDVWIGRSAIVLPGVEIGHGAVVGAGAVVTKSVPPYAIVAGNPARIIRFRFSESIIQRLLATQWWSMQDEALLKLGPHFNDVEKFLEVVERGD
ncbi:CatB-related O-acetyltransferase [Piscinibacter terrae]|uniref:Antibiotic acetyltransferase n=1 Tax=Piscinibacter terrae TaxID=2496871 RepID=A0A3N7JRF0_9BURK|nr:CatB-related O-acetyltransferase [Albitalea terrae]RQP21615.1 antibiotic acetyltransferase [Albitalea terrae]